MSAAAAPRAGGSRIAGETEVADPGAMAEILSRLGLAEARYQENFREEWRWGGQD